MTILENQILKVGFVGAGNVTKRHITAISARPDTKVVVVADPIHDSARLLGEPYEAEITSDSEGVLTRDDLDIIYICTPHYLHHPYALAALKAGKHVFIEKPMANTLEECEEINQVAKSRGLIVAIGHHQRYIPPVKRLGTLVRDGAIGEVRAITDRMIGDKNWGARAPWWKQRATAGGGMLMNLGVHQIDRCLWLSGMLPQSIYARVRCGLPDLDVDTDYTAMLGMPDQSSITISATSYPCKADFMLEVIGTKGRLWFSPLDSIVHLATSENTVKSEQLTDFDGAITEMTDRFITTIQGEHKLEVDGQWGEVVGRAAQFMYRSSEEGKALDFPSVQKVKDTVLTTEA